MSEVIIITGIHRSGTTWLSSIFETNSARIVNEPMNLGRVLKFNGPLVTSWYQVLSQQELQTLINACRTNSMDILQSVPNITSIGRLALFIKLVTKKNKSQKIVIKDPFILFSIHNLNNTDIKILEVSKKSYELADSFRRANWRLNKEQFCIKTLIKNLNIDVKEVDILNDFYNYPAHFQALALKRIRDLYFKIHRNNLDVLELNYTELNNRDLNILNSISNYTDFDLNYQNYISVNPRGPSFTKSDDGYSSVEKLLLDIELSNLSSKRSLHKLVMNLND